MMKWNENLHKIYINFRNNIPAVLANNFYHWPEDNQVKDKFKNT